MGLPEGNGAFWAQIYLKIGRKTVKNQMFWSEPKDVTEFRKVSEWGHTENCFCPNEVSRGHFDFFLPQEGVGEQNPKIVWWALKKLDSLILCLCAPLWQLNRKRVNFSKRAPKRQFSPAAKACNFQLPTPYFTCVSIRYTLQFAHGFDGCCRFFSSTAIRSRDFTKLDRARVYPRLADGLRRLPMR